MHIFVAVLCEDVNVGTKECVVTLTYSVNVGSTGLRSSLWIFDNFYLIIWIISVTLIPLCLTTYSYLISINCYVNLLTMTVCFLGLCSISEEEWLFSYMYSNTSDDNIYRLVYASGTEFSHPLIVGQSSLSLSIICGVIMRPHPHGSYSGVVLSYFTLAPYF